MSDEASTKAEAVKPSKHKYEQYVHHDVEVTVREDLKGKHRNVCMCYDCAKFNCDKPEQCKISVALYNLVVKHRIVAPVWECAEFQKLGTTTPATSDAPKIG